MSFYAFYFNYFFTFDIQAFFAPFIDLELQTLGLPGPKFSFYTSFL